MENCIMKTTILKLTVLLLIFAGFFSSCKEKLNNVDYPSAEFLMKLESAPLAISTEEISPKWLAIKIEEIENTNQNDIAIVKVRIFKGKWKNDVTYIIHNNISSCLFCDVYYDDGKKVIFSSEKLIIDFDSTSENWELIYEFENGNREGDVPYKPCSCEFDVEPVAIQGEARFFIDTYYDDLSMSYMIWYNDRDIDNAYLMLRPDDNSMPIKVNICNFPDFAKEWNPENGIIVYYEGVKYPWCEYLAPCRGFCETMILTKLKIK